jgi:hypothetical protein
MDYFYDGQLRKYLTQFIRALSGFSYKDGQGNLKEVPVRFGTANKQAANVLRQNSENFVMQAPFISVYINNLELSRNRMQDPTFVSKVQVREREYDSVSGEYINSKGSDVTVERIMPNPFQLSMIADIWTSNIDQKLQILEQLVVLFNPALEIQTSSSYLDWTSLTTLELMDISYTNQTVPTGDQDLEIASLTFMAPIWLSPPAKVKRMGVITSIIARIFDEEGNLSDDILNGSLISQQVITMDGYAILVTNNATAGTPQYVAKLLNNVYSSQNNFDSKTTKISADISWREVLEKYPGRFTPNLSKLQIIKADNRTAIATISLNSNDETLLNLTFDAQSLPTNTLINSTVTGIAARGTIDAIIDPSKPYTMNRIIDLRFLILSDISTDDRNYGPTNASLQGVEQWGDLVANANDIIMWDGTEWKVIFNSRATNTVTYITNAYTGVQYKWDGASWTKSMEGTFVPGKWQLIL